MLVRWKDRRKSLVPGRDDPLQGNALQQHRAGRREDWLGRRQSKSGLSITAVSRSQQCKEGLVLIDRQQLTIEGRPALRAEVESKCFDLPSITLVDLELGVPVINQTPGRTAAINQGGPDLSPYQAAIGK